MTITLEQRIAALEAQRTGDTVPYAAVKELVDAIRAMFNKEGEAGDNLFAEIGELAKFINNAKKELSEIKGEEITSKEIPDASNQLGAIVQMTEAATGRIMDELDGMSQLQNDLRDRLINMDPPLDPDALSAVDAALNDCTASITKIYEACNFQDITGQRIQKVVRALQEIERHVLRMVVVFGLKQKDEQLDEATRAMLDENANLLQGPALAGQGLEQDDIDAILSKLL
jgi:chemotaxis protein CheZ